jgi:hypothetical protein
MKYNKWTVVLAAAGMVSLVSARAEEEVNSVLTGLSSTVLSGYVDTSAQWNFGSGNAFLPDYKFGGSSKADGFNLNVVQLRIEKPFSEEEWAAGYRVDLWAGPDANALNTSSVLALNTSDIALRQAYVALRVPVLNGLDFKIGAFDSIIGYESVESPSNPNHTRSYGHTIEPQTHTGVLASYRFSEFVSASVGVANTVGPIINERAHGPNLSPNGETKAESYKTYMGSVAVTAPDDLGFLSGSTLYGGVVNGFTSSYGENQTSWYVGGTVATPVEGLRLGLAFDALDVHDLAGETWTIGGYGTYQITEKLSFHLRAEYLRDRGDAKYFTLDPEDPTFSTNPDKVLALTATAQYDLWKNVISRVELRWDHSLTGQELWGGSNEDSVATLKNAWLLAANVIYRF